LYGVLSRRSVAWGSLYGIRAAIYIYVFGGRLTPDSGLFSHGGGWYSSPALALAGYLAGWQGVCVAGIAGAVALGSIVARYSHGYMAPTAVALLPPGWYAMEPASDAAGAAAAAWSYSRPWSRYHLALLASLHVEAALVVCCARCLWSLCAVRGGTAALGAGVVAQWHPAYHFQMRYFLPGLAMLAIEEREWRSFFSLRSVFSSVSWQSLRRSLSFSQSRS